MESMLPVEHVEKVSQHKKENVVTAAALHVQHTAIAVMENSAWRITCVMYAQNATFVQMESMLPVEHVEKVSQHKKENVVTAPMIPIALTTKAVLNLVTVSQLRVTNFEH